MAKNILVISCDVRETRAALIENGIIAELHIERKGRQSSTVGNVYLGKVTRVLPGLQAAFIEIGQERAAFLHVEDLIRPDDFDEYLAGGRKLARGEGGTASEGAEVEEADEAEDAAEVPGDAGEGAPRAEEAAAVDEAPVEAVPSSDPVVEPPAEPFERTSSHPPPPPSSSDRPPHVDLETTVS